MKTSTKNLLICESHVRRFLLDHADKTRHHKFNRVRQSTIDKINAAAMAACKAHVQAQPSVGKTL